MKALCQPGIAGDCVQCGQYVSAGIRRTCSAWFSQHPEFTNPPAEKRPLPREERPQNKPGLTKKVGSFCTAIATWKLAGSPVRSQERVNELLAICQACPHLLDKGGEKQRCGSCGCPINSRVDIPRKNKLALATESCPLDPPKWTAESNPPAATPQPR